MPTPGVFPRDRGESEMRGSVPSAPAGTVPGVTQSSDAPTQRLPVVGALAHPHLPARPSGAQTVRNRGRVSLEVLEATRAGLGALDDVHRREVTETPPPLPF